MSLNQPGRTPRSGSWRETRATGPAVTLLALKFNLGTSIFSSHPSWAWLPSDIYSICPSGKFPSLGYQSTRLCKVGTASMVTVIMTHHWQIHLLKNEFLLVTTTEKTSGTIFTIESTRCFNVSTRAPGSCLHGPWATVHPVCWASLMKLRMNQSKFRRGKGFTPHHSLLYQSLLISLSSPVSKSSTLLDLGSNSEVRAKMSNTSFQSSIAGKWIPFTFN